MNIGGLIIPCANLDNGERVISDRSLAYTLGIRGGGAYWKRKKKGESGAMLPEYVSAKYLQPFINEQTKKNILDSITYKAINGVKANAIRATALADICDIWIKAKQNGALVKEQILIAFFLPPTKRAFLFKTSNLIQLRIHKSPQNAHFQSVDTISMIHYYT